MYSHLNAKTQISPICTINQSVGQPVNHVYLRQKRGSQWTKVRKTDN